MYSQYSNLQHDEQLDQEVLDPLFTFQLPTQVVDVRRLTHDSKQFLSEKINRKQQSKLSKRKRFPRLQPLLPRYLTRKYQRLSLRQQAEIIQLRYGKIGRSILPVNPPKAKEIASKVGVKLNTVSGVIWRYQQNNFTLQYSGLKKRTNFKSKVLTEDEQQFLCQNPILQEWAHLSLNQRCALIQQEYGKRLTQGTLARYYRSHGVIYKKVGYTHPCSMSEEQLKMKRTEFVANLISYLNSNTKIIYFDETSANKWDWKTHVWQDRDEPLLFYQNPQRGKSLTVLGAISTHDAGLYYCIAESTNKESVYDFFQYLSTEIVLNNSVLVLDNHRAHHSLKVVQLLRDLGVTVLFLPPSTSYFNAVEFVWRYFKNRIRKAMIEPHQQMISDQQFFQKVESALDSITAPEVIAILEEAYPAMLKHLRSQ